MTLHRQHQRDYVAASKQEIPASECSSNCGDALGTGCLISIARCTGRIVSTSLAQRMSLHCSMMPQVLPAPFKLHKPPPPWRIPSSRCI
jgi:hypothetical protein